MLARLKFQTYTNEWQELTPENYKALREVAPGLPAEKPEWHKEAIYVYVDVGKAAPVLERLRMQVQFEPSVDPVVDQMRERLDALEEKGRLDSETNPQGASVEVHIPDFGLLMLDRVKVCNDACTEDIQGELDAGWRILSVCPQPGQRRPDYVLARRGK